LKFNWNQNEFILIEHSFKFDHKFQTKEEKTENILNYFASQRHCNIVVHLYPAEWATNCGAYWLWMVAMPEVKVPGAVT